MGNTSAKPHPRQRNKKQVHWKAADRPAQPGKPFLVSEAEATPDVITIRWNPPYKDGGSPIIGYLVEHRRTGSPHWVRATPLLVPFPELKLSGLEPGWRYQFRVSAENAVGMSAPSDLSEPLTVTLQRSAVTAPRFTQELSDTIALENEKVEFVAHFLGQPSPKICWFKDGFEIFSSRRTRILTESDCSILTIHQSALCDEGEIKCTATNKAGHASTKAKLSLEAPPSIRLPRQYEDGLLFEIGEVIRLKVSVAGQPAPLVFWSHNGQTIKNDERYEIDSSNKSCTLRVDEARRTDRGEYQIKAVNKLGQDIASFLVTVTDKPSPPGKARVVMNLGRSVTLAWNEPEDDGGCKIGNYIIEYYRVGWDVWLKAATSRQLTSVLGDLIEGSEYKFRVKAESPYGVSEPSQESETVFIPDPKRGLLTAPVRSRSQPRDLTFAQNQAPVLPERKHKPRSQSTTRVDSPSQRVRFDMPNSGTPVRPERTKIKSPPKTPELSPTALRRDIPNTQTIDREIFDRASMTRELAYGSPEIKVKKPEEEVLPRARSRSRSPSPFVTKQPPKSTIQIIDYNRPRSPSPLIITRRSPSPLITSRSPSPMITRRSLSPVPKGRRSPGPPIKSRSPSPSRNIPTPSPTSQRRKLSKSDQMNGSSEFMLVLLPNGDKSRRDSDGDVEFDESLIPPPLSLSAPELGAEPPPFAGLKYSSSSSELLHERALLRFYEAAEAEEQELLKKRLSENKDAIEGRNIPKIQINSNDDDEDIVGLERTASFKRRYSGGINRPQQFVWAQRRHSLRSSGDYSEVIENKLHKFALTVDEKREIMMNRKRSKSEEQEEEVFEKIRIRTKENRGKLERRNNLDVVNLEKWGAELNQKEEEYEESLSEEEESESEEDERIYDQVPSAHNSEEEDRTYHPASPKITEEPFEILTEPKKLPDPNFIPKPILKQHKPESVEVNVDQRQRSLSLAENARPDEAMSLAKRGSLPWTPVVNEKSKLMTDSSLSARRSSSPMVLAQPLPVRNLSAIASISGIAAASIVIPKAALAKKLDEEEAKIVVDHYSDIVRSYGQKRNKSERDDTPQTNTFIRNLNTNNNVENTRNLNGHLSRRRNDSDSSSQRSSSPTRFGGRITKRKGSPMVLNREVFAPEMKLPPKSPDSSRASSRTSSKSRKSNKSPSPMDVSRRSTTEFSTQTKKSPSPPSMAGRNRAPMMKEIMTQTSLCIDTIVTPIKRKLTQTELERCAEITVRTTVDYITDLAMLVVACWLYVFSNELLAVPVLVVLVYRQLQEAVRKRLPKWMLPKPKES